MSQQEKILLADDEMPIRRLLKLALSGRVCNDTDYPLSVILFHACRQVLSSLYHA